jgi:hypothetical protein
MRKIYTSLAILSLLSFAGCSKDILKPYDDRIIGTWQIDDIDKFGFGGSINDLPFKEGGTLRFNKDGTLLYTTSSGSAFNGTWDIQKKTVNSGDDSEVYRSLQITAVNFNTQQVLGEYYDDINFVGTNHIKARIMLSTRTYVTHLRR